MCIAPDLEYQQNIEEKNSKINFQKPNFNFSIHTEIIPTQKDILELITLN